MNISIHKHVMMSYKVGTISDEGSVPNTNRNGEIESQGVIFAKLLKSTDQRISPPNMGPDDEERLSAKK